MIDLRADDPGPPGDSDRLPWLEAVYEEQLEEAPSAAKLILFVLVGLASIGLIVGAIFWMRGPDTGAMNGQPELIAAPAGDYKIRPDDPGGMQVEGRGDTAFATSEGANPRGAIDMAAVTEAPLTRASPQSQAVAQAPVPSAASKASAPTTSPPTAPADGAIQLGAFSTQAAANSAWKAMSGRFAYLAPLSQSVTPVTSDGRTLYRLRASGPEAIGVCDRLRVAGEQCVVID